MCHSISPLSLYPLEYVWLSNQFNTLKLDETRPLGHLGMIPVEEGCPSEVFAVPEQAYGKK